MTSQKPEASSFGASTIKGAVRRLIESGKFTRQQLAGRLGLTPDEMDKLMADHGEADLPQALHRLLEEYGIRPAAAAVDASRSLLTLAANPDQEESDPFVGSAEDVSADETRQKIELFAWADNVLGLSEAELELALEKAIRRFECNRETLKRIIKARRSDKQKARARAAQSHAAGRPEEDIAYYGPGRDYKVSSRGVFVRLLNAEGDPTWEQICTTRIDLLALTRDTRQERWGTYVEITNRDGRTKQLAIPHSLTAADKTTEIASILADLGVGVVMTRAARQSLVQFLTLEVEPRITAVSQIGWHHSDQHWLFVLPDDTFAPRGFTGARPVLQTSSLHTQHGLDVSGTVQEWRDEIAAPLAGNSNVHLCVGTALAGPLLLWANEPPGFFHLWGRSKIAKSLVGAIGQSVWGRPKVPGEADAFGASWTATTVGLERYAVLRSDIGGYFDEIGEGSPKAIRPAVYMLANGSTKLRGTQDITLRPMESFRVLGISTGEPTMEAFLSSGGEKVPAGLAVRLVDVPAEVRPDSALETCSARDIETFGKRFYPLCGRLHGAVGRAWLQHLVDLGPDEIKARLQSHRDKWLALPAVAAVRAQAVGQVRSVLNRFALVAAALRMAIEAELLPWTNEDTDLGIAACMSLWAATRKGRLDLSGEVLGAVEQIRSILTADLHGRFIRLSTQQDHGAGNNKLAYATLSEALKRDTLGFVKGDRILVEPIAWRRALCAGYDPKATAQHLRDEGLLYPDSEGKLQRQEKVLRGETVAKARFYVLDMRILDDGTGTGPKETQS